MSHIKDPVAYHAAVARRHGHRHADNLMKSFFKKGFGKKANRYIGRAIKRTAYGTLNQYAPQYVPLAKKIVGDGDYKVSRGIYGPKTKSDTFKFHHLKHKGPSKMHMEKGEIIITHSEYIGELIAPAATGPSPFNSQVYTINPGNSGTFPWLSTTAINFQQYEFKQLMFEYKPLVSDSATTTTTGSLTSMGSVIFATQYDSVIGPYINKNTMENSDFSASCKPSEKLLHAIECKASVTAGGGLLYTSSGINNSNLPPTGSNAYPTNTDVRWQNLGLFQAATNLIPNNNTNLDCGELWVHYTCRLLKPQLNAGLTNLLSSHYIFNSGLTDTAPFGSSITIPSTNFMTLSFTANSFSFPLAVTEGVFLCTYIYINETGYPTDLGSAPTVAAGGLVQIMQSVSGVDDGVTVINSSQSQLAGQRTSQKTFFVKVDAPGSVLCKVTFAVMDILDTGGQAELFVTPWNLSVTN